MPVANQLTGFYMMGTLAMKGLRASLLHLVGASHFFPNDCE